MYFASPSNCVVMATGYEVLQQLWSFYANSEHKILLDSLHIIILSTLDKMYSYTTYNVSLIFEFYFIFQNQSTVGNAFQHKK